MSFTIVQCKIYLDLLTCCDDVPETGVWVTEYSRLIPVPSNMAALLTSSLTSHLKNCYSRCKHELEPSCPLYIASAMMDFANSCLRLVRTMLNSIILLLPFLFPCALQTLDMAKAIYRIRESIVGETRRYYLPGRAISLPPTLCTLGGMRL